MLQELYNLQENIFLCTISEILRDVNKMHSYPNFLYLTWFLVTADRYFLFGNFTISLLYDPVLLKIGTHNEIFIELKNVENNSYIKKKRAPSTNLTCRFVSNRRLVHHFHIF